MLSPAFAAILRYVFLPSEVSKSFTDEHKNTACFKDFCWTSNFSIAIFEQEQTNQRITADEYRVQALLGTFLVCALGASLLAWFHTTEDGRPGSRGPSQPSGSNTDTSNGLGLSCECKCSQVDFDRSWLTEPMRRCCETNMMLLVPLFVYLGVQQYLIYSIFVQVRKRYHIKYCLYWLYNNINDTQIIFVLL
jgi:hypothetical protein